MRILGISALLLFELRYYKSFHSMKARYISLLSQLGVKLDQTALIYIIGWEPCDELAFDEKEKPPKSLSVLEEEADREKLRYMSKDT